MLTSLISNRGIGRYAAVVAAGVALLAAGCGSSAGASGAPVTVRLGYFPNITHAPALVGVGEGLFARDLAPDKLDATKTFNAGPAEVEAMLSEAIDIAFIGPSPSITAYDRSNGAVRIISGATSGGAALVVKSSITSVDQLKGRRIATPQLGNTQDVALRAFLRSKGFRTDTQGGGDVHIQPQDNSQTIDAFKQGLIDGAWVPEPYLSQLVQAGGRILVDERDLWPGGQWVTTDVLVRTAFLKAHPATVKRFLQGLLDSVAALEANPAVADADANTQIQTITGKKLTDKVLSAAFANLSFTVDPLSSTLQKQASDAEAAGLLSGAKVTGIDDLTLLDQLLAAKGQPQVAGI